MSIEMKYIDNGIGVLYFAKGILTGKDIIDADRKQLSNIGFLEKKKYFLGDFSQVNTIEISNKEIKEIAVLDKNMNAISGTNVVAIVANQELVFGLSRMWATFIEMEELDWHTSVFKNSNEAKSWLKKKVKDLFNLDLTIE